MLANIQQRRELPTRVTQFLQVNAHKALQSVFQESGPAKAPWQLKVAVNIPGIQHLTARVIGVGVLPEHVKGARLPKKCPVPLVARIAIGAGILAAGVAIGAKILKGQRKRRFAWSS
jgi:hypothetical protein